MESGLVVTLKSGGPRMTVGYKIEDKWFCQWFVSYPNGDYAFCEGIFAEESLKVTE